MSDLLRQLLIEEEGFRNFVYLDSLGIETIGVGRNLKDKGLSDQEVGVLLANDMREVESQAAFLAGYSALNDVQKAVICSMVFQLGIAGVKGFKGVLAAIAAGNMQDAAKEMRASKWANQTAKRALRAAQMMETGIWVTRA